MFKKMLIMGISLFMLTFGVMPAIAAIVHNVQPSESLYKIAANNGITVNELKQTNNLKSDLIYVGDKLNIPNYSGNVPAAKTSSIDLLARLVNAEAGGEPFTGQVAVASVILNRTSDQRFPETIAGNIFKPHQFESVSNGLIWKQPTNESYKAASAALKGWDPTYGAKYFFNPAKINGPSWVWTRTITQRIGNHVFGV